MKLNHTIVDVMTNEVSFGLLTTAYMWKLDFSFSASLVTTHCWHPHPQTLHHIQTPLIMKCITHKGYIYLTNQLKHEA